MTPTQPVHLSGTTSPALTETVHWSLRGAAVSVALAGLAVATFGISVALEDASRSGEMLDGLGIVIGLGLAGIGLFVVVLAGVLLWMVPRHPAGVAAALTACGAGIAWVSYLLVSGEGRPAVVGVLGGVMVALVGLAALLACFTGAIHSAGGRSR